MLFNSFEFLVFGALFYLLWSYFRSSQGSSRYICIILASLLFYGWWNWKFAFLLVGVTLSNFVAGLCIDRWRQRKQLLLAVFVVADLLILGWFKYAGFLTENLNSVFQFVNTSYRLEPWDVVLPIGISFFTFQSISYIIDVYKERLIPTKNILHYCSYQMLFPQLIAGPIVRASDLLPQISKKSVTTEQQRWDGTVLIVGGYFKKMVLADNLAPAVNSAFGSEVVGGSALYWWVVVLMFAMQIYCDFSGYTDIACGLAKWMGYEFPQNFRHPYLASSLRDFWTRWHVTLSTWFRDYVYIPLGGSRNGKLTAHINVWITMVLCGLWHGASWTYVIWGGVHAVFLSIERVSGWPQRLLARRSLRYAATMIVLVQVCIAWVFFRASSFQQAVSILSKMFSFHGWNAAFPSGMSKDSLVVLAFGIAWEAWHSLDMHPKIEGLIYQRVLQPVWYSVVMTLCVYCRGPGSAFVYFQF